MKKRILMLLLALTVLVGAFTLTASAAEIIDSGTCGKNLTWTLDNKGTLTISGSGDMYSYYTWMDEDIPWYSRRDSILSVDVEEGITSIGASAFYGCKNLTSITIPESVTSIGDSAFSKCKNLTSITIPEGVTSIGDSAFYGCEILKSITLPKRLTSISSSAFYGCASLSRITIPESVTSIGENAFSNCESLTSITIPEGVTSIGNYAFSGINKLTNINIPKSVTSIGNNVFGYYEFETDTSGGSLTGIWVDHGNPNYSSDNYGVLFDKNKTRLIEAPNQISETYSIPESITSIGVDAFWGCENLTSITIPDSVTEIGIRAFYGCGKLTSITIPDSVTSIGEDAFWGCDSLISITIPDSVTIIDDTLFYSCDNLTSITIPEGVTSIGDSAFSGCKNLTSITIPESVLLIRKNAFDHCRKLDTVHYTGTQSQAAEITVLSGNTYLTEATWHYECNGIHFADIAADAYYAEPVLWAVNNGITNGLSADSFGPEATCTRAQIVTFLWRANGSPEPTSSSNPFSDVSSSDYFYKAVLWAVENGITSGTSATTFSPDAGCTRGQVATFLWRAEGEPATNGSNIFTDIAPGAYYYDAVLWAVENSITNGMGDGTFAPDATCTRGQIVTFLYRAMV